MSDAILESPRAFSILGSALFFVFYVMAWRQARNTLLSKDTFFVDDLDSAVGMQMAICMAAMQRLLIVFAILFVLDVFVLKQLSSAKAEVSPSTMLLPMLYVLLGQGGGAVIVVILLSYLLTFIFVYTMRLRYKEVEKTMSKEDKLARQHQLKTDLDVLIYFQIIMMAGLYMVITAWYMSANKKMDASDLVEVTE